MAARRRVLGGDRYRSRRRARDRLDDAGGSRRRSRLEPAVSSWSGRRRPRLRGVAARRRRVRLAARARPFYAVGLWYQDFREMSDDDVPPGGLVPPERRRRRRDGTGSRRRRWSCPTARRGLVLFAHGSGSRGGCARTGRAPPPLRNDQAALSAPLVMTASSSAGICSRCRTSSSETLRSPRTRARRRETGPGRSPRRARRRAAAARPGREAEPSARRRRDGAAADCERRRLQPASSIRSRARRRRGSPSDLRAPGAGRPIR